MSYGSLRITDLNDRTLAFRVHEKDNPADMRCWPIVLDAGPTIKQYRVNISSLLGKHPKGVIAYTGEKRSSVGSDIYTYYRGQPRQLLSKPLW